MISFYALVSTAGADTLDFGGFVEKFKGGGDKIPPECQVEYPAAASEPFFIKWNCIDDNAAPSEIRTELWIYRKSSQASELVVSFLGFPAAAYIDKERLQSTTFSAGLPVSFKLLAKDRAGITTISRPFFVSAQDVTLDTCTLQIETEATASSGGTTGLEATTTTVTNASVTVADLGDKKLRISTTAPVAADPCETESVCDDDDKVAFTANLTISGGEAAENSATGTLSVSPGNVTADIEGTFETENLALKSVDVSGETTIDGAAATVHLTCQQ